MSYQPESSTNHESISGAARACRGPRATKAAGTALLAPAVSIRKWGVAVGRRSLRVADVVEVLEHWAAGRPLRAIAQSLGLDRHTVRKYITPARGGYGPSTGPPAEGWAVFVAEVCPELGKAPAASFGPLGLTTYPRCPRLRRGTPSITLRIQHCSTPPAMGNSHWWGNYLTRDRAALGGEHVATPLVPHPGLPNVIDREASRQVN